jgi:hypothetical protein
VSQDDPLFILLMAGLTVYLLHTWIGDLRAARAGRPNPGAYPGAVPCSALAVAVAVAGAWVLLATETGGEYALGVSGQQSNITVMFLLMMVCAAFYEELVFRGFFVVTQRGRAGLIGSIIGFSLVFALMHPFLWDWKSPVEGAGKTLVWDFSLKAWWSTGMVFAFSLWQYTARFFRFNPTRSLIPCIAGHLAKNLGVFAIKLAQGHVSGWR